VLDEAHRRADGNGSGFSQVGRAMMGHGQDRRLQ